MIKNNFTSKLKYIQLAGSFVKIDLSHLNDETKTLMVEISHSELKKKNKEIS